MRCMLWVALVTMTVVGNASAQDYSAIDRARSICQQYGYRSGTVQFADCVRQTARCQITGEQRLEDLQRASSIFAGRNMVFGNNRTTIGEELNKIRAARGC